MSEEKNGQRIITTYICSNCCYSEKDVFELSKKEENKMGENYEEDRRRFCFDKEKGNKAVDDYDRLMQMAALGKEIKERDKNKHIYEAVAKIKKLPFGEVQKLLIPAFEENSYTILQSQPPEMVKVVNVTFTVVDSKSGRDERSSKIQLKKILNSILESTNWRLVQSSIDYRLGFLTGRLQGLSSDEDLKKLVEKIINDEVDKL